MYTPSSFKETDRGVLFDMIDKHGFATLFSWGSSEPHVTHVPLLLDRGTPGQERLLGHVARANKHWTQFDGKQPALAIFHGPHAYISPAWYSTHPSVPTWNYAAVHVTGVPRTVDADATGAIVRRLVEKYESHRKNPWPGDMPPDFFADQVRAIVGFEISIDRIDGKYKLSQNRDATDREQVLTGLSGEPDNASRELAQFSREYFSRRSR